MGILIKPLITEKMSAATDKFNRFGFVVEPSANKIEIKKAVEAMYGVVVQEVNTMVYAGKAKSRFTKTGLQKGRTSRFKKAVVTLAEGDSIDFFSSI